MEATYEAPTTYTISDLRVSPDGARYLPYDAFVAAMTCSLCRCNHSEDENDPNRHTEACDDYECPCHDETVALTATVR